MRYSECSDPREILGKPLRESDRLPLQEESQDKEDIYYHEAQISSLCWGPDDSFWTELFLLETYFGSEDHLETYLNPASNKDDDRLDPPLAGTNQMKNTCFDPREYWLWKLEVRLDQITEEYTALVETFNTRMEIYVRSPGFQ